jgi:hypothetical protein
MDPVNHYNNAPFIQVDNYDLKTKLRLNIHEWCASCNISYSLGYERIRGTIGENCIWYIEIPDPVMAVLFKLTWM